MIDPTQAFDLGIAVGCTIGAFLTWAYTESGKMNAFVNEITGVEYDSPLATDP